jgi:hypothetical protein
MERDYKYMENRKETRADAFLQHSHTNSCITSHQHRERNLFPISYSTGARNFPSHTHKRHLLRARAFRSPAPWREQKKSVASHWQAASEDEFSIGYNLFMCRDIKTAVYVWKYIPRPDARERVRKGVKILAGKIDLLRSLSIPRAKE